MKSEQTYEVAKKQCKDLGNGMFPHLDNDSDIELEFLIDKMHAGKMYYL